METNNKNEEFKDLEEMRQQMETLRGQLDEQVKVNDVLMQKQMCSTLNSLKRNGLNLMVFSIVSIPALIFYKNIFGISWACCVFLMVFTILDGTAHLCLTHMVRRSDLMQDNLATAVQKMIKVKKLSVRFSKTEWLINILTVGWLFYESINGPFLVSASYSLKRTFLVLFGIGLVLSIFLQIMQDRTYKRDIGKLLQLLEKK